MLIEPGVFYHPTIAIDRKRIQSDIDPNGSSLLLRFGNVLFRLNDDIPVVAGTGDQNTFHDSRVRSMHGEGDCSDLRERDCAVFPVDLEPGLIVVERPIPGCALEPEFANLPSSLLCLGESGDVTPKGIVDHLEHFRVYALQERVFLFQRDDPRLHFSHRRSEPVLPRSITFFEKFVVEPPTGIECGIQPCLSDCIGIRPVLVGNDHLLLHLRVNILFQRIKTYLS